MIDQVARTLCAVSLLCSVMPARAQTPPIDDPIKTLVGRLELDRYKAVIKGLAQFGDRQQGTDRNRAAVDWIEAQLQSYGCNNTERLKYLSDSPLQPEARSRVDPTPLIASGEIRRGAGGSRLRGMTRPATANSKLDAQSDPVLRAINAQPQPTTVGSREEVYCTKVGVARPDEMYIVGAHMDGQGFGEAADDDASGTALVMEIARIFSSPDVQTDRSIRFVLWNNEEGSHAGSRAYALQRAPLRGKEEPPGSGNYPEPKWLGMVQHDMVLWDGMPRADGTVSPEQRAEADVNIEFQSDSKFADQAVKLAFFFRDANEKYATDYPAAVGHHMSNTDSSEFMNLVPAISFRENERGMQIGAGWNPHYHQATDTYSAYSDKDFRLGLNTAQTTLAGIGLLAGVTLRK
jgi:hypothetical protein